MTDEQGTEQVDISPAEFMRRLRPELYSDSTKRSRYELDRATLTLDLRESLLMRACEFYHDGLDVAIGRLIGLGSRCSSNFSS